MQDFQNFDVDTPRSSRRQPPEFPWGIYVVSATCGLVTLLALRLVMTGSTTEQLLGGIFAILSLALCVGIALRANLFRLLLLALLYLSYVADVLLIVYAWQAGSEIRFGRVFLRMALTVATILYLQRSDVRLAFGAVSGEVRRKLASWLAGSLLGSMCGFATFLALLIGNNAGSLGIEPNTMNVLFLALFFLGGLGGLLVSFLFRTKDVQGDGG